MRRATWILFVAVSLVGCGPIDSVSPEQCQAGDWTSIGFADGKAGRSESYFSRHQDACAKVGLSPNIAAWSAGRARGVQQYCTPQNAYSVGRKGSEVSNVCSGPSVTEINRANAKGLRYHAIGREISNLRTQSSDIDTKLLFLGTPKNQEQQVERRRLLSEQKRIKTRISNLELRRIEFSVL